MEPEFARDFDEDPAWEEPRADPEPDADAPELTPLKLYESPSRPVILCAPPELPGVLVEPEPAAPAQFDIDGLEAPWKALPNEVLSRGRAELMVDPG